MSSPRFSIVTPVYNASAYLPEMIRSVKAQTFTDWELRIVDDGSCDGSGAIIEEASRNDPRIHAFFIPANTGSDFVPRRLAIEKSLGEFVVNVDADDIIEKDYLLKLHKCLSLTGASLAYADMWLFQAEEEPKKVLPEDSSLYYDVFNGRDIFHLSLGHWKISGVGATRRSLALRSLELYDRQMVSERIWNSFDNENLSRLDLFLADKTAFCNAEYFYRQLPDSVSHQNSERKLGLLSADINLCRFAASEFGRESKEHILAQTQLFHHVVESLRLWGRNFQVLSPQGREILKRAFLEVDKTVLSGNVSPRYLGVARLGFGFSKIIFSRYGGS